MNRILTSKILFIFFLQIIRLVWVTHVDARKTDKMQI